MCLNSKNVHIYLWYYTFFFFFLQIAMLCLCLPQCWTLSVPMTQLDMVSPITISCLLILENLLWKWLCRFCVLLWKMIPVIPRIFLLMVPVQEEQPWIKPVTWVYFFAFVESQVWVKSFTIFWYLLICGACISWLKQFKVIQ